MGQTAADAVNDALLLISGYNDAPPVTGDPPTFDGSVVGIAAGQLYPEIVNMVGKEFGWDFSRNSVALTLTINPPPTGWALEYFYPLDGLEIRQVTMSPAAFAQTDPFNPLPQRWTVGNAKVAGVPTKVIWCNTVNAEAIYTNQPPEGLWDALFYDAVVRQLASGLAMALEGRPNTGEIEMGRARTSVEVGSKRAG